MEDIAVGEHGQAGDEEPGRARRNGVHKGKQTPGKNEDAETSGEFFRKKEAKKFRKIEEEKVEENVVPLRNRVQTGGIVLLDQPGEPGVVHMAAEITGFDVVVPEARNQEEDTNRERAPPERNSRKSLLWGGGKGSDILRDSPLSWLAARASSGAVGILQYSSAGF